MGSGQVKTPRPIQCSLTPGGHTFSLASAYDVEALERRNPRLTEPGRFD
jgi:hypothetical protein